MNARIFASVSFAVIGVIVLSRSILLLQNLAAIPRFSEHYEGSIVLLILGYALPTLLLIGFGSYLIVRRDRMARRLVPDADLTEGADSRFLAVVAFAILGFYLFITTLPWLGSMTTTIIDYIITGEDDDLRRTLRIDPGRYIGYLIQLVAGIVLFLRADRVADWWGRRVAAD